MNLQLPKVTKKFIYIRNTNILKEDVGNRGLSSKYHCIRIINLQSANYFAVLSPWILYSDFQKQPASEQTQHCQLLQPSVCALHITEHTLQLAQHDSGLAQDLLWSGGQQGRSSSTSFFQNSFQVELRHHGEDKCQATHVSLAVVTTGIQICIYNTALPSTVSSHKSHCQTEKQCLGLHTTFKHSLNRHVSGSYWTAQGEHSMPTERSTSNYDLKSNMVPIQGVVLGFPVRCHLAMY